MFQNFDSPSVKNQTPQRLRDLREVLKAAGADAYLVPRTDKHQGEYVPACFERLMWLTGFTGSAGIAVVGLKKAAVFVDGRYTVQARREVDTHLYELPEFGASRPAQWITHTITKRDAVLGYDPWLHTIGEIKRFKSSLAAHAISLKPLSRHNLVDAVWGKDRPPEPMNKVIVHPVKNAGETSREKVEKIQAQLSSDGLDYAILTLPDSICWLLNIRGTDIAHNTVVLCFGIVPRRGKVELFIDPAKLDKHARTHLKETTRLLAPEKLGSRLADIKSKNKRVGLDPSSAAIWFENRLKKSQITHVADPCLLPKAIKNKTEISGSIRAHRRDGAAMVQFLSWLSREAPLGHVDEISAAMKLEELRAATGELAEISFDTISGAGPNGAIVHYRVNEETNRKLKNGELYLVDSGAQYYDGTTDITRTVAIGTPTKEMRTRFTCVLKGHIAIATARFPKGTRGCDLDPFARRALWSAGLDYDHGTGHGVGSYLSVHEGPVSISRAGKFPLKPGMILSNEPGYYLEGHYGIRIENLILVENACVPKGGEREMLSFQTLSLAPIDLALVDRSLLGEDEIRWLNTYHARVLKELSQELDSETRSWLKSATAPL